jgi:signal transduction histidine kinase
MAAAAKQTSNAKTGGTKMFPSSLSKRVNIAVTVIFTISMLFWAHDNLQMMREKLLLQKKNDLLATTVALQERFSASFYNILEQHNALKLSADEQRTVLNRRLQPVIDDLGRNFPDVNLEYYSRDFGCVAIYPFNVAYLGRSLNYELKDLYLRAGSMVYLESTSKYAHEDRYVLAYPLNYNGEIIGHVAASIKASDISNIILRSTVNYIIIAFIFWFLATTAIFFLFKQHRTSLLQLAKRLGSESSRTAVFQQSPELIPALETVEHLREQLEAEYKTKETLNAEMSRLDRLNLVGEMAAGVAHEIRNPLTVISGFLQTMRAKPTKASPENIDIILTEIARINAIVTDFLSLARNKALHKSEKDLNNLVKELGPLLQAECNKHSIELFLRLSPPPLLFFADEKEIKQLILNLARNGIDAIENKGTLIIAATKDVNMIKLIISDSGSGISPQHIGKIFDPFFSTKNDGTGLGLAICKSIVERHSGKIELTSTPNRGTTFYITFPAIVP